MSVAFWRPLACLVKVLCCCVRYSRTFIKGGKMDSVSVYKFRDNLKAMVDQVVTNHVCLKVTRRAGEDFVAPVLRIGRESKRHCLVKHFQAHLH